MKKDNRLSHISKGKTVLITGASGTLGSEVIKQLGEIKSYRIIALTSKKELFRNRYPHIEALECFSLEDWEKGNLPLEKVDTLLHCAFSTASDGEALAASLLFTKNIFEDAKRAKVSEIINVSSRSVYGTKYKPLWNETTPVSPDCSYGLAKYASELLLKSIFSNSKINFSNIRLSSLIGKGLDKRIVTIFVKNVLEDRPIRIIGGKQVFSFLDIKDAASGIIALLSTDSNMWKDVYNLGTYQRYTIQEIANIVTEVAKDFTKKSVEIEIEETDTTLDIGMDSKLFYEDTGWRPQYSMRDTVNSIFECMMLEDK